MKLSAGDQSLLVTRTDNTTLLVDLSLSLSSVMPERQAVAVYDYRSGEQFQSSVCPLREPAVLRGCPLGPCTDTWSPAYLTARLAGLVRPVHVTRETNMNFLKRNFSYDSMELSQLVARASNSSGQEGEEKFYLRAVSEENPRTKPVTLQEDFPTIAQDFSLPAGLLPHQAIFSSVLRVSSGDIRVWTHYDVMDNIYCQIVGLKLHGGRGNHIQIFLYSGHKKAVLWPPTQVDRLYLQGDKSRVSISATSK